MCDNFQEEERLNLKCKKMDVDNNSLSFEILKDKLSHATYHGIKRLNFDTMTKIQAETIPAGLDGKDIVGSAKTGKLICH